MISVYYPYQDSVDVAALVLYLWVGGGVIAGLIFWGIKGWQTVEKVRHSKDPLNCYDDHGDGFNFLRYFSCLMVGLMISFVLMMIGIAIWVACLGVSAIIDAVL